MKRYFVTFQKQIIIAIKDNFQPVFKTMKYAIKCNDENDAIDILSKIKAYAIKYPRITYTNKFKDRFIIERDYYNNYL